MPIIIYLSTTVYVDLGLLFFSTVSLLCLFQWIEKDFDIKFLILSAAFCGLAMGTKYNGLVTAFLLTLFVPFSFSRFKEGGKFMFIQPITHALIFIGISLAVFSPWMVRNYVWKKNPIYPLYNGLFQSGSIGPEANPGWGRDLFAKRRITYGETWWEMALLPIRVFFQGKDGSPRYFDGRMNPFILILPLFAFWKNKRDPPVVRYEKGALLIFAVLYFAIALFTREMRIRYILPMISPLVILSAFGIRNLFENIKKIRRSRQRISGCFVLWGCMIIFMGMNVQYMVSYFRTVEPIGYLTGKINREEYLRRHVREYQSLQYINTHVPLHSRTLFLFLGNRGYYCDRPYVLDRGAMAFSQIIKRESRPEKVLLHLRKTGITHLLIRYDIFDRWKTDPNTFTGQERDLLNRFMRNYTKPLYGKNNYIVFVLKEKS
jgi:hypothetical protein